MVQRVPEPALICAQGRGVRPSRRGGPGGEEAARVPAPLLRWRPGCCGPPTAQHERRADVCREGLYLWAGHACLASSMSDLLICESYQWKLLEGGPSLQLLGPRSPPHRPRAHLKLPSPCLSEALHPQGRPAGAPGPRLDGGEWSPGPDGPEPRLLPAPPAGGAERQPRGGHPDR